MDNLPKELSYELIFHAPVGVFTGLGIAGLLDRTVVRDANKRPYIQGSTVKGRLRFFAERVLRSQPAGLSTTLDIHGPDKPYCKQPDTACTQCRLFGNPIISGLVSIGQAWPSQEWDKDFAEQIRNNPNPVIHPDADIRPGIALSRQRRTTLVNHLFQDETIPRLTFSGRLSIDSSVSNEEQRFLIAAGLLVDSLGSRKAVGRGRLNGGIQIKKASGAV